MPTDGPMGTFDAEGNYTPRRVSPTEFIRDFENAVPGALNVLKEGHRVSGTVVRVDSECVLVEFGYRTEGVIMRRDLTVAGDVDPRTVARLGDKIETVVFRLEDRDGRLLLSRNLARSEPALADLERRMANGDRTVSGTVVGVVNGGLLVDAGFGAFLPASQVEMKRVRDLHPYVGLDIEARVIEFDRIKGNVVLSRRDLLEERAEEARSAFLASVEVGMTMTGVVSDVRYPDSPATRTVSRALESIPFELRGLAPPPGHERGANNHFNDNLTEKRTYLSEADAADAAALLSENDVRDLNAYRCSLCDGWHVGHLRFRVFVDLGGIDALVPEHEIAWEHFDHALQVVRPGDTVDVKIIGIDRGRGRIVASLKATQPDPWEEYVSSHEVGHLVYGRVVELVPHGAHVQIAAAVFGFVSLAEMSNHRLESPEQVVSLGEDLWLKIAAMNAVDRSVELSIRGAAEGGIISPEYAEQLSEYWENTGKDLP